MNRLVVFSLWTLSLSVAGLANLQAQQQTAGLDAELQRLQGNWRVIELVENGQSITQDQMKSLLPGGGLVEIVDYTLLFKSPVDGHKSTKSFRTDATSYPKKIAIFDRDRMTGQGIYQHDGSRLVICVAQPPAPAPSDFSAPAGSNRMMIVMEPINAAAGSSQRLDLGPPPTLAVSASPAPGSGTPAPSSIPAIPVSQQSAPVPAPAASVAKPAATASANQAVANQPVPGQAVAGRVLTDAEVKQMLVGTWRFNDGSALIDIAVDGRGTFSSFRHAQQTQMFHQIFVPTPVSSGTWTVQNGQMFLKIASSWRPELVNSTIVFAVRSISPGDAILIDTLGRLSRAERLP